MAVFSNRTKTGLSISTQSDSKSLPTKHTKYAPPKTFRVIRVFRGQHFNGDPKLNAILRKLKQLAAAE